MKELSEFAEEFLNEFSKHENKMLGIAAVKALLRNKNGAEALVICAIMSGIALRTLVPAKDFNDALATFMIAVYESPEVMPDVRLPDEERRHTYEEQKRMKNN